MVPPDLDDIVALHVQSWRHTYAGMLDTAWLAGPVEGYMSEAWHTRLITPERPAVGFTARLSGRLAGFVFAIPHSDDELGTLVDNLHVSPGHHGQGVGTRLLSTLARSLLTDDARRGVYLEALEANAQACRYYERVGATINRRFRDPMPDGQVHWSLEFTWPDAATLLRATTR